MFCLGWGLCISDAYVLYYYLNTGLSAWVSRIDTRFHINTYNDILNQILYYAETRLTSEASQPVEQ